MEVSSLNPRMLIGCSALAILVAAGACDARDGTSAAAPPPSEKERAARRAEVRFPNDHLIVAEIADTPELWQRGYMFRRDVPADEGMVFLFPEMDIHPFWMKNTLVPLDMIWMDDARAIIHIEPNVPPCRTDPCPSYGPMRKASAVLELRAGIAAAAGLKIGDRLRITIPQSNR